MKNNDKKGNQNKMETTPPQNTKTNLLGLVQGRGAIRLRLAQARAVTGNVREVLVTLPQSLGKKTRNRQMP